MNLELKHMRISTPNVLRRASFGALGLTCALTLAAATPVAPAQQKQQMPKVTNTTIMDAIEDELLVDPAVPVHRIDISVTDGVATLRGSVNNILAKKRATNIAETVKGVRSVVNLIEVRPNVNLTRSDLKEHINQALLQDPATESYEVDVKVAENGVVTLGGEVESWAERELAETVARGVAGVTKVRNAITMDVDSDRPDYEIAPEIERRLRWSTLVDDALIDVKVNDGKVILSGTVGSAAEKRQARVESWVAGVTDVDASKLRVRRWARDEDLRGDKYVKQPDGKIAEAVRNALRVDPRIEADEVTAEAKGGVVTLRGTVDHLKAKRAATTDARQTVGVLKVRNRLKVDPELRVADELVADNVRDALLRDPYVERYEINVTVEDGVAMLTGSVETYFEKAQAEDSAARADGVVKVANKLRVENPEWVGFDPYIDVFYVYDRDWYDYEPGKTWKRDLEIHEEINDELWWSPFVDSDDVKVSVTNGVATLRGTVDSWDEYRAATENAFEGGAEWVVNNLVVKNN